MITSSLSESACAVLPERALIAISGPDWRSFLQGLITQDVESLADGELRYAALLTPQGRLLYDLFVAGHAEGATLDVPAEFRDALLAKLKLYRLRAKVELAAMDGQVRALFGDAAGEPGAGWLSDPRLPGLGWRAVTDIAPPAGARAASAEDYDAHRLAQGAPDLLRDRLSDKDYALEANLDLLHAVDFRKGCFVGQETTSRMKRRSVAKSRLVPIVFDGAPPEPGSEVLVGERRAGEVRSGRDGRALALLRLDRAFGATEALTVEGRLVRLDPPDWLKAAIDEAVAAAAA
jgi:folate-binding protein YgfZ